MVVQEFHIKIPKLLRFCCDKKVFFNFDFGYGDHPICVESDALNFHKDGQNLYFNYLYIIF